MYYAMQNALLRRIFPAMCTKEKIPCTIQNLSVRNQSFMSLLNELMADDQNLFYNWWKNYLNSSNFKVLLQERENHIIDSMGCYRIS